MLLIDIRSTNASAAEFILYRLKLYLAGRHHHHHNCVQQYMHRRNLDHVYCVRVRHRVSKISSKSLHM